MIEVLLATMNKRGLSDIDFKKMNIDKAKITIINQGVEMESEESEGFISIFNTSEKGISKSRNMALRKAREEICLIADDDIIYKSNALELIQKAFDDNPNADIITFQIETPDGGMFKNYSKDEFWHNERSLLKVSSVDIALRRESIVNKKIEFDELFGLGSKYNTGEQNIFLIDCIRNGLKIKYMPIPIVIHPYENSGRVLDEKHLISKGAVFYRIFKMKGILINFIFGLKKRNEFTGDIGVIKAIKLMLKGSVEYRNLRG